MAEQRESDTIDQFFADPCNVTSSGAYDGTTVNDSTLYCHETFLPVKHRFVSVNINDHPSLDMFIMEEDDQYTSELVVGQDDGRIFYTYDFGSKKFGRVCDCNTCSDLLVPERSILDVTSEPASIDRIYYHA